MADHPYSPSQSITNLLAEKKPRLVSDAYASPQDELETSIAEIWAEVLHLERVGRTDVLFSLGGDSLHMMLIASRVFRNFGVEISIEEFFENPTVMGLADVVRRLLASEALDVASEAY